MNRIEYEIDVKSQINLKKIVGGDIQLVYADRIIKEYDIPELEASYFVLKTNQSEYFKISVDWFECPVTSDSYYKLKVDEIEYTINEATSIFSFGNKSSIRSVSIAKKNIIDNQLYISHSFGIIIERDDLKRIIIAGGESAFQNIVLCDDEENILKLLKNTDIELLADL